MVNAVFASTGVFELAVENIQNIIIKAGCYFLLWLNDSTIVRKSVLFKPGGLDVETNRDRDRERP